jgi:hypothetical protein
MLVAAERRAVHRGVARSRRLDGRKTVSDLLTPHQVQEFMLEKSKELDDAAEEYVRRLKDFPEALRVARIAMNTAVVGVEGKSADLRKAKAEQQCEQAIYAKDMAEALKDSAKAAWQTKLAQLNAGQSLSSTVREEMRLAR